MRSQTLFWRLGVPILALGILIGAIALWPERAPKNGFAGDWTCSMHPQVRQKKFGQCPICGMNLVPATQVTVPAKISQRAGVETEPLKYRELFKEVRTVGKIDFNESRIAYISARISGRVDRVFADFTGIQIKKGDHLVDIYSPDLQVAQGVLLRALESVEKKQDDSSFAEATLESARAKLRLLGILPQQLAEMEKSRVTSPHLTIYAPMGGTVIEKSVRAGQYVREGDMLYRIADLDPIWLYLDIYEYDLGWVRHGQSVEVKLEAYPTETFHGMVTFIDPFLDDKTRTVRARVNLKNSDRRLKPAMYASALIRVKLRADGSPEPTGLEGKFLCPMHPEIVTLKPGRCPICEMPLEQVPVAARAAMESAKVGNHDHKGLNGVEVKSSAGVLAIRATSVLDTGRRKVAYRQGSDGGHELVELHLGPLAQGKDDAGKSAAYYPVLSGLKAGELVVVRGGFLLDSHQQISGMPSLLFEKSQTGTDPHAGQGGGLGKDSGPGGHKH